MSDVTQADPTQPVVTQGNDPSVRTPEGTIKDQQTTQPDGTANTDAKPAEAKPAEAKPAVPDKYEFKAPEGFTLQPEVVEKASALFKDLGLSQEAAQKLVDFQTGLAKEAAEGPFKAYTELRETWRGEVVKDPTIGNGTDNLKPEVRANIAKAIDSIGDAKAVADFKAAMDLTGSGDNPAIIRGLNALGKLLSEGTPVRGSAPSPHGQVAPGKDARPSPAQAMYPSLPSSAQS